MGARSTVRAVRQPAVIGFERLARRAPGAPAVVEAGGRRVSRGELAELADRLRGAFAAAGLEPGDRIAVVAGNCAPFLAACLAAIRAGLYVVPVNWHLAAPELCFVLEDCGARALLADARLGLRKLRLLRHAAGSARLAVSIGAAPGYVTLDAMPACRPPAGAPGDGRVMPYTSATTGRPKGVVLPRSNARVARERSAAWQVSLGIGIEGGHVHLCASMLYHSAPLERALTALHMGHSVVLVDRWRADRLLELIACERVTTAFMVPAMFVRLLALPDAVRLQADTRSLKLVVHSGAPCPVGIKRRMLDWWGPVVWETYGASEGQGTVASPADAVDFPGTVGRPIPGSAIRIVGSDGTLLGPGQTGVVWMRPHTGDRFEYHGNADATARSRSGDFITAGDIGYVNEHGLLFLVGRSETLILCGGCNVYGAEIERVLLEHPAVADCAVVGRVDALLGEAPVAIVEPAAHAAADAVLSTALLEHIAMRLAPAKLPRRIEYVARLPRDPCGKLLRRSLA